MFLKYFLPASSAFVVCLLAVTTFAQEPAKEQTPDTISGEKFAASRSLTEDIQKGKSAFVFSSQAAQRQYKFRRRRPASSSRPVNTGTKAKGSAPVDPVTREIGVTVWRLESAAASTQGGEAARLLVQSSTGSESLLPKRVTADSLLNKGDRVRLSFEVPEKGFLYVFDREVYADGRMGEPYQIFPTTTARGGDNSVRPGMIVDIPSLSDASPFFRLESDDPNWIGEFLTVVFSVTPLKQFPTPRGAAPVRERYLKDVEQNFSRDLDEYDQDGTAGNAYTAAEKSAASGTRRQLTQTDPLPQTLFTMIAAAGEPSVLTITLRVK